MSIVRATSIKGINVPANGPEINLNKFNHGSPLDFAGTSISGASMTIGTLNSTTQNTTTCNATNITTTGRGNINLNGSTLIVPTGTQAERPTSPALGSIRCNTDVPQMEMYVNSPVNGLGWEKLG